jgi:gliding motility-associated-like protein
MLVNKKMTMEKPTTFKSVKTVFTFIKNLVSDTQNQLEKLEAPFVEKQTLQPLFFKAIQNRKTFLVLVLFFCLGTVNAQIGTAFSPRLTGGSVKVKGDIILIGNTAINKVKNRPYTGNKPPSNYVENPADFSSALQDGVKYTGTVTNLAALTTEANLDFNGTGNNNDFYVEYTDIDSDPNTFNSTSADLAINNSCKSIVFAGLYWSAIYPYDRSTDTGQKYAGSLREDDWNKVMFKVPNGSYVELTASKTDTKEVIFDGYKYNAPHTNVSDSFKDSPYVCFKDVTDMLQKVKNTAGTLDADGTYTVANVRAARGKRNGGGAGGWTLVVIYESPSLPSKYISVFDGYVGVDPGSTATKTVDYTVSGFQTLPVGFPVVAKIGVGALEGDNQITGDDFQIKANSVTGFTKIIDAVNKVGNFFDASITNNGASVQNRVPKSTNTMGMDIDNVLIENDKNLIIPNNETGATLRLSTDGDGFGAFVTTFAVDIIEPKIILTKVAKGVKMVGNTETEYDLDGLPVNLGQEIRYVIGFRNQGNDDAKSFTITDVLPQNVIFDQTQDIFPLPKGVTLVSYTPATRTLVFKVDNLLVIKQGPTTSIKIRVRVVNDCNELIDACSNVIKNTAISRYFGDKSPTNNGQPYGDGSYSFDTGCVVGDPSSTNFLVGVDKCRFSRDVSLCGNAVLTAALGYASYAWTAPDGSNAGNTRSITVTKAGTYTVQTGDSVDGNCKGILQNFVVKDHIAGANNNPISEYANNIDPATNKPYTCTRDNIEFPKIFLCGKNDTRVLDTKISQATSIIWQETTDVPPSGFPPSCPYNEAPNWTNVGTPGRTFTANRPGAFRVVITYGNNCVNTFYFSVFQNPLDPKADVQNIVCNTKGSITVTTPPINSGYTYSLDNVNGTYVTSNVFNNVAAGSHTVYIKQTAAVGETSSCPFHVDATILTETFKGVVKTTDPLCSPGLGSMNISGEGLTNGNYQFIVKKAGTSTVVADSGIIDFPNYVVFDQKFAPGKYDVEITSPKHGCTVTQTVEIFDKTLKITANVSKTLACGDGEITVQASGGTPIPGVTPSYYYSVNGVSLGQINTNPVTIPVTRPLAANGEYKIVVTDYNSCSATQTVTLVEVQRPTVTINQKNVTCYNSKEGEISITVTPATSGYAVSYNVDGGAYTTLPTTGLNPGKYSVIVKYTYGTEECLDTAKEITITGPTAVLTASGGVAALSGCGLPPNEDQGMVRITNAQGGVPFPAPNFYRYSFDDGQTWIIENYAYVNPRATPYTLLIKDAAGCIFEVKGIVLDPKPAKPTFDVPPATYNCNGEGTVTVTANTSASANYTYSYYLGKPDPANSGSYIYTLNTNTPANVFKDIPVGDYKIKVEYNLVAAATFSNLLKEDFGSGPPTTTPGIAAAYCFNDQREFGPYQCKFPNGTPSRSVEDNAYSVASFFWRSDDPNSNNTGAWFHYKDHTTNPNNLANTGDPNGRYLLVNVGNAAGKYGILYSKPIVDVIENQDVIVDFYVGNLLNPSYDSAAPIIRIELIDQAGNVVARDDTGEIAPGLNHPDRRKWVPITLRLNPGNNKNLTFVIRSGSEVFNGNDLVIDDIWVRQLPKSCLSAEVLNLKVENGKGFKAEVKGITGVSCNGGNDGGFGIYVENFNTTDGFYYTLNGGAPSPTWVKATASPVLISGKPAGAYDVRVRYANDATSCNFTIPTTIPSKDPFVVNATASVATCKGATVTATAVGGTPNYTLTLKDKNSPFTKTFPADGILTEIPAGTYIISGVDSKSCSDAMDTELVIDLPTLPKAEVVKNSGLCFDSNATITINITGGVGKYTYQVSTNGGTTYSTPSPAFDGPTFTYIATAPATYDFLITDSNGCEAFAISQKIDKKITATADVTAPLTCKAGSAANATIEVKIDGGTGPYTYTVTNKATSAVLASNGTTAGPSFTYPAATAATYVFAIKDANDCPFTVEKTVDAKAEPTATFKVENVTCFNAANGYIDITAENGTAPFTYQFNGTGAFTSTTHYGSLAGSVAGTDYSFTVKDATDCTKTYTFKVFQPADIVATASITTPYTCLANAIITASVTSGGNAGGFTYVLRNTTVSTTVAVATNNTGLFENLTVPGDYTVTITDSKSCSKTVTAGTIVALNPPKGMTLTPSAVTCPSNTSNVIITNVVNDAGIAVPTAGLEYRIKSPTPPGTTTYQPSNSFTGLAAGVTYTFEVRDANKCVYEKSIEIKSLPAITVTVKSSNNISCLGSTDGSAVFTVTGMGNSVGYSYKVDALPTVTGLTSPVVGSSFDISVPNLGAGTHTITVTNTSTTCSDSEPVTILAPSTVLKFDPYGLTHVTCDNKGTATINVVGGWGTYTYTVTPTSPAGTPITQTSSNVFSNLNAGDYSVSVKDLNGCEITSTFTINPKVDPVAAIDAAATDLCAGGAGATITVTPKTQTNYVYSINNGTFKNDGTFTGLIPGDYTITVKDISTGCSIQLTKQVVATPVVVTNHKITKKLDCSTSTDAVIEVTIGDGYPDYRYRVNINGAGFPTAYTAVGTGVTTFTYPASASGSYVFEILDSKGCKTGFTENVAAKVTPDFTTNIIHVKCFSDLTGKITVNATPVSGTYEYSKDNGSTWQPSNEFLGLGAASYTIVVRDTNTKCFVSKSITVNGPAAIFDASAIVSTVLKCGTNNASQAAIITVTASGGTPYTGVNPYRYTYDTGNPVTSVTLTTSNTFTINASGLVDITVTDANGCTVQTSATVVALTPPTALAFTAQAITCEATKLTTNLKVDVTGGKLPLKYEITSYTAAVAPTGGLVATNINANTHTFTGLVAGTYNFTITDANGCTVKDSKTIDAVVPIQVNGSITKNVSCNNLADATLAFDVSGNITGGYTYELKDGTGTTITGGNLVVNTITYTNLKAETYTFTVINDATKCQAVKVLTIANPDPVTIASATGPKVFCDRNNTTITVTASGGTGTLYYAVVKAGTTPPPAFPADYTTSKTFPKNTLVDGESYDVYVSDAKGCSATTTANIVRDAAPTIVDPAVTCFKAGGAPITVTISGTVYGGAIQYGIDGVYNTNPIKTISAPGDYVLSVKDNNGCEAKKTLHINDQLTLTVTPNKEVTCTATLPATTDAKVTLSAGGGNSTYTYEYKVGTGGTYTPILPAGTNEFYTSAIGDYYFKVKSDGCEAESTVPFVVTDPVKPVAHADVTNLSCYQSADGIVTIVPTAGVGPFTYIFNGGAPTNNSTFSNLPASTGLGYPYTIIDSKGCPSDIAYAIVTEPAQIQFSYTTVDMTCPGPTLGSVTVSTITNGVGPFTYELRNAVTGSIIVTGQSGASTYTFPNLSYGDFVLTVSDINGCSNFKDDVKIVAPPNELDIDLTTPIATCADGATIIVEVNPLVIPAIPLYEFGIYNLPTAPFTTSLLPADPGFPMRRTFTGLTPGVTYTFVVYDPTTNCYYFEKAAGPIAPITSLASVATTVPVACKGTTTGGVSISLSGTTATQVNYEIFVDQSDVTTNITGTITMPTTVPVKVLGLSPGTYYVKFTEVDGSNTGCTSSSLPFVVTESAVNLTVTATSPKNDNCKNNAGQVVATPKGGTGPFKYIINQSATPLLVTDAWGADNANIFNVEAGFYYVWVKDAYDCINFTTVTVNPDPTPLINNLAIVDKCAAEGAFEVRVTMTTQGVAPYYISVNGGDFTEITDAVPFPYTIKGLNSGPVDVIIKDFNGCESPLVQSPITPTPTASAQVTKVLDCSVAGNAVEDATITIKIEKGTLGYSYEVKKGAAAYAPFIPTTTTVAAGVTTITYTVAPADADVYQFRITDANNCRIETAPVIIDAIVPIALDIPIEIQPLCNGVAELGSVELGASGGKGPYTYSFNGSLFTSKTLYDVVAGPYTYIVKDDLGCELSGSGTLGTPSALAFDAPIIIPLSCGPVNVAQSATVTLVALAGTGTSPYKFSFNNSAFDFNPTYTVVEGDAGKVIPYGIQDANGCEVFSSVTITPLNPPKNFTLTQGLAITCSRANTTVTISGVIDGVSPLSYQIISPTLVNNPNNVFSGLLPDVEYIFQVTDGNNCTFQKNLKIDNYINIDIKEQSTVGITCSTAADGKASFYVSGFGTGVGTYHYILDGSATAVTGLTSSTINLTGLAAGPHDIEVFDDETDCHKLITFTIATPPAALVLATPVVTPLGCTTFGAVTLTAIGGWGDYTFTLTQPDNTTITNTDGIFENLTQLGFYDVAVKDANSCTVTVTNSFELLVAPKPTLTIATTSDYCYYNTNSTTLVITAASTSTFPVTFEYSIDNGDTWHTSNTFDKLTPKTYLIKVRDNYGCESSATSTDIKTQLFASVENKGDIFCTNVDGTIRVSALGGYPDYSYTVAINGGLASAKIPFGAGFSFVDYTVNAATPGSYVFTVYDAQNCAYPIPAIVMTAPAPVVFTAVPTSPYCAPFTPSQGNISNGSILFKLTSTADPKYTYSIQRTIPAGGVLITQDTPLFTGLIAGTYTVNVTSGRNCDAPTTVVIADPSLVVATATPGAFTCASPANTLNATIVTVTGAGGAGTGAVGDYTYSADGTNWKTTNTFNVIDNQMPQTLTYFVKDANGCIDSDQITISPFPTLKTPTLTRVTQIACNNTGEEINVQINGGLTPYNFNYQVSVDGGAFGLPAIPVTAGTNSFTYIAPLAGHIYHLKINDLNTGCFIISDAYAVPLFNTAKVIAAPAEMVSCFGNADGKITINITDYKGPYTYQIYNGVTPLLVTPGNGNSATVNPFTIPTGLAAGTAYTISITETAYPFCTVVSNNVIITQPPVIDLSALVITNVNQNCKTTGAVLTVDASTIIGGTPGFTYAFVPAGATPVAGDYKPENTKTIPTTKIAPAFDAWDVYVKDKNGCPEHVTVNISLDRMPVITNVTVASQCYNAAGYRIDVAANGVGTLEYSLDGKQFQSNNFFTVFSPGDYTVTVRDKNKCEVIATTPVKVLDPLTLRGEVTKMSTCTTADGEVTLYAGGGSTTTPPSYVYTRDNWTTISLTPVFSGLAPGTYIFKVRDTGTSPTCEKEISIEIEIPTLVTGIVATPKAVSCNGASDGRISVAIATSNDNPIYMYSLAGPVNRVPQESPIFNDLPFGNYVVTVISGRGCPGTAPVTVEKPDAIVVNTPLFTQYICNAGNTAIDATITVPAGSVTGGSGNYVRYQFVRDGAEVQNDERNVYVESDYLGGNYVINVFDNNGCQGTYATVPIDPYAGIADLTLTTTKINCRDDESVQVIAVPTRGTLPTLTYTIEGTNSTVYPVTASPTGLFAGLKPGSYLIKVTNPITGCGVERNYIVNEPNTFRIVATDIKDVTCFTDTNGSITLTLVDDIPTPEDNAGPFTYVLTHESGTVVNGFAASTELKLSNLAAGKYTITATLQGVPYCPVTTEFTIQGPTAALEITLIAKQITCESAASGEIVASAIGGWKGDYLYKLDGPISFPYGTENHFKNLTAGTYTVTVKDSNGCEVPDTEVLSNPTPITATIGVDTTLLTCYDDKNATLTVNTVAGGSGNFTYTLHGTLADGTVIKRDAQPDKVFAGLGAGTYYVTVADDWTCSGDSNKVTIAQPNEIDPVLSVKTKETCDITPVVTLTVSGGTAPYFYSADGITYSTASFASSIDIALPKTTAVVDYKYYVKDSNNCVSVLSNAVPFAPVPELVFEKLSSVNVACKGSSTGSIYAIAIGGLGNYVYTLLDAAKLPITPAPTQLVPGTFTNLPFGDYYVSVNSVDCDQISNLIKITEPNVALSAIVTPIDVTCAGFNNGKITVAATGGTGKYTYAITPELEQFFDVPLFENLKPGKYTVRVQDENVCYIDYEVEIFDAVPLVAKEILASQIPEYCFGDKDGVAFVEVEGGKGPYTASITGNGVTVDFRAPDIDPNTFSFTGLLGGIEYVVTVRDQNECPQEVIIKLPEPVKMIPTIVEAYDCENDLPVNSITVSIEGNIKEASYPDIVYTLLLDGVTTGVSQKGNPIFKNLPSGNYSVEATFAGCSKVSNTITIKAVQPLTAIDVTLQSKEINTIVVKASGGVEPYEYSFNGEAFTSSNSYQIYKTDIYKVIVRDKNGCQFYLDVPGEYIDICLPNYFTPGGAYPEIGPACGALAYKDLTFKIFDRYGRAVANYRVGQKWDGRYNGQELPSGDYWYVLKLNDEKDAREFVGHFTLYR